jgi:transposase
MNRTTYAIDIAKRVMQLHWVDAPTGEIKRRRLTREKLVPFFAELQPVRIVMEACGGAHHWARCLSSLGHQVELLPPRQIRAFVRSDKDDAADARAIWLASQHSDIRRVPIKSCEQQAVLSLHRTREHWKDVRTATINCLRGLLYEFGVVLPRGRQAALKTLAERRADIDNVLPALMSPMVDAQLAMLDHVDHCMKQLQTQIAATSGKTAQRLRQVNGIGLLGASALAATLGDASGWRSGREFSASLGLVPKHSGTGGKTRIGHLSKRGDSYLRTLFMHGARSAILHMKTKPRWLEQLLLRRPFNVVVAALANKMARIAWALVAHGRSYDPGWSSTAPIPAAAVH